MHEDLVTVGTKELARNFDHRIVGIGFVAVGYCCKCHQLPPRHHFTIMAEDRFLSIRRLNTPSA
jgi:hypothetical protein